MEKQLLRSPCYDCIKSDKNKNECAHDCKKLKSYQENIQLSRYEDLKGSVFQIYTLVRS